MKFIPSLFILATLALPTTLLNGCGGGSSGSISVPTQNKGSFTFTHVNSPAATNLLPLSGEGPFINGGGTYVDYFEGTATTATYETVGSNFRTLTIRRTTGTHIAPSFGTSYDLTAGGANTLIYSFQVEGIGISYEAVSGKVTIAAKKGNFVTLRLQNVEAKMRFTPSDYRIRINGTFTYDESKVPIILPTGAKPRID